jgi:serine/threonine protein kinase
MDDLPTAGRQGFIAFACPRCGQQFRVNPEFAGRQTPCPTCNEALIVPTPPEEDPAVTYVVSRGSGPTLPDVPPLHGGAERYTLGAEIARGSMDAVLQATDRDLGRDVAVRYLLDQSNAETKRRFVEEAQITGQLEHPNIVPIHELGVDAQGNVFCAMRLVPGRRLADVLEALAANDPSAVADYPLRRLLGAFVNVCHALAYAHSRGVLHGDLTPANIVIGEFGAVHVTGWGSARLSHDATPEPTTLAMRLEQHGSAVPVARVVPGERDRGKVALTSGQVRPEPPPHPTPIYQSPEQAQGHAHAIDERSDVYALGAVLYAILTLHPPISKVGGAPAIVKRITQGQIAPPDLLHPDRARAGLIPPALTAIAMKALSRAPASRHPSVELLRRDIEQFLDGRSAHAQEAIRRGRLLTGVLAAALLVLTIAAAGALFVNLRARSEAEDNYEALKADQQDRHDRMRQAVPALVLAAQHEMRQRQFDAALEHVNLALEFDADHRDGRLVKGQLLIARLQFKDAAAELAHYLAGKDDAWVVELKRLCERARPDDEDKSVLVQIAQNLLWRDYPMVAEEMLRRNSNGLAELQHSLLRRYRARLETVWPPVAAAKAQPNPECTLTVEDDGLHLKLVRDNISDLAPLTGMVLSAIEIDGPELRDLSALRGIPLRAVKLKNLPATDLSVLKGMSLVELELIGCHGTLDLGVLQGMPLRSLVLLRCNGMRDLTALQGMPLASVRIDGCHGLSDLAGLHGAPLKTLTVRNCSLVRDLTPLRDLALTALDVEGCAAVRDVIALKAMPLVELNLSGTEVRDLVPLRGLPLGRLYLNRCAQLKDLSGLTGLKLHTLELNGCGRVEDLAPLKGMPLRSLALADTDIRSLAPVQGMPLQSLGLGGCRRIADLSPLAGMPLVEITLPPQVSSGVDVLRKMATLQSINGQPAAQYWQSK